MLPTVQGLLIGDRSAKVRTLAASKAMDSSADKLMSNKRFETVTANRCALCPAVQAKR
jgi:hypothetical protein